MNRALFVDDEREVLRGLRRGLHGVRGHLEPSFALSGSDALELLARERFDVILSDLRMPGMSGLELLDAVRARHPTVVRFVLSGHVTTADAQAALSVAHRVIHKPCASDLIDRFVSQALYVRSLASRPDLNELVGRVASLPSRPVVYTRLRELQADPGSSLRDVIRAVRQDPGVAAKLLHAVNAGFFALPRAVSRVEDAVQLLGRDRVSSIVLCAEAFGRLRGRVSSDLLDEAQALGEWAAWVAGRLPGQDEDSVTASLLHELGRLVLALHGPDRMAEVSARVCEGEPLQGAERAVFGVTHAEVGTHLLGLWGLPHAVLEGIGCHHTALSHSALRLDVATRTHIATGIAAAAFREAGASSGDVGGLDWTAASRVVDASDLQRWHVAVREGIEERGAAEI